MVSVCSIRACERGLALIVGMDRELMIPEIPVKKIEERMTRQPFQHLIDEG
jgi:hypothetical protein